MMNSARPLIIIAVLLQSVLINATPYDLTHSSQNELSTVAEEPNEMSAVEDVGVIDTKDGRLKPRFFRLKPSWVFENDNRVPNPIYPTRKRRFFCNPMGCV
ncbi:hypothetical protein EG68_04514 [Paragonimus skrjabini miyazakii]|uniref:Uncharacterized protein n=1 Tax=Paragonimus skrjabini miyazakii TaxID=59628 RepID=A0A8S9YYQ3_9TREM|nr:hypothetical protein EG68_04514 [Paragonimus skrjabini miyazakii]